MEFAWRSNTSKFNIDKSRWGRKITAWRKRNAVK